MFTFLHEKIKQLSLLLWRREAEKAVPKKRTYTVAWKLVRFYVHSSDALNAFVPRHLA